MHPEAHSYDESATLARNETIVGRTRIELRLVAKAGRARLERDQIQADGTMLSTTYFIDNSHALLLFCGADPFVKYLQVGYTCIRETYQRFERAA